MLSFRFWPRDRKKVQGFWSLGFSEQFLGGLGGYSKGFSMVSHARRFDLTFSGADPDPDESARRRCTVCAYMYSNDMKRRPTRPFYTYDFSLTGALKKGAFTKQFHRGLYFNKDFRVKLLYGLKQSPREWYSTIHNFLISLGFVRTHADHDVYVKENLILLVLCRRRPCLLTR